MFLKRFIPKSLFGRFLMIIIVPTVLVQLFATYSFYERHWSKVSLHMSLSLAGEITQVVSNYSHARNSDDRRKILDEAKKYLGLRVSFTKGGSLQTSMPPEDLPRAFNMLSESLGSNGNPFTVSQKDDTHEILVNVEIENGLLSFVTSSKRLTNPTTYIFILWMTGTALVLLIVAIFFLKNQVRSITRLTKAAEKFGKGEEVETFKPQGAQEVRRAAIAFLEMKDRIKRHISQRMEMLAGISHDLRTPLTRMKLQLAMLEDSETARALEKDVDEMEMMLNEYLDFVRGAGHEERQDIRLSALLQEIVDEYTKLGKDVVLRISNHTKTSLRPLAFKRCIVNIIDNALKFGTRVILSVDIDEKMIRLAIDDNGPGIPPEKYDKVFQPFVRLDEARNLETGGAGLGLAIVRDIVNSHGGEIKLDESALGGLRFLIKIPT